MAINNNPDLLYLRSREDLLQYEDARLNSLLQAMADFYTTRNDQSIWGNFLRALAIELSKLDYDYSYDIVNKDPSLLTPPDIRRRWAAPLYVSASFPSKQQFDAQFKLMLVQLLAAYRQGTTVQAIQDVIFAYTGIHIQVVEMYKQIGNGVYDQSDRNSISVTVTVGGVCTGNSPLTTVTSLLQLQTIIRSLYNAIALAKPAHVGLEFTTTFGECEDLDCLISPRFVTQQQYALLPTAAEQAYFTRAGYAPVSPALFWKADTAFVLGNVLRDSNGNFQLLTSLGSPPNKSGAIVPVWGAPSLGTTADGNLAWQNISPAVVSTAVADDAVAVTLSYPVALFVGAVVRLANLTDATWLNNTPTQSVPLTVASVSGASFTAHFAHPDYPTLAETAGTATFALPAAVTALQWDQLNTTWQGLYQKTYQNTCAPLTPLQPWFHPGIGDTLRIFVRQVEAGPQGPMLIQAPVLNPANPKTTVAAYGKLLCPQLTPAQWGTLPPIFVNILNGMADGTNARYGYVPTTQFLHEGEMLTITGFSSPALNVTARIGDVVNLASAINATSVSANVVTVASPNSFAPSMLATFSGLTSATFLNGQTLVIRSATPASFTVNFTHASYLSTADTGNAEVSTFTIPLAETVALEVPSPTGNAGLVTPTLQSAYYLSNGNYVLGLPPLAVSGAGIGSNWVPGADVFQGQIVVDSNGNTQLALNHGVSGSYVSPPSKPSWATDQNATTNDNGVLWRNVGKDAFSASNTWVGVLNMNYEFDQDSPTTQCSFGFTGEVGNVDPSHQYGLVAPRLDRAWEISGGDQLFIFGLY